MARYLAWSVPRWRWLVAGSLALLLGAVYLVAFRLPIRADLSYLLPPDAPSVVALRAIESRLVQQEGAYIVIQATSAQARAAATEAAVVALRDVDAALVLSLIHI